MVNVELYDLLDDDPCRWEIKGHGIVWGKDLEAALKEYFQDLEDQEADNE